MSATSSEETVLRITAANKEPITLRLETGAPLTVRLEVESNCACQQSSAGRAGSYTDTDLDSLK